jgi:hypothetical protein
MADRFDLDAIEADDALLDLLAAGGEPAREAGEHDPAVKLLAELRLAVEVEGELPVETIDDPESFLARCAALNPITDPFARKMATRGLALGVAAVAALSVSGVAAAVNGNPLSPYEKVIEKMVDAVRPQTSFPKEDLDGLPIVDKTKIVKVGKDFQAQQARKAAQDGKGGPTTDQPQSDIEVTPPLAKVLTQKPTAIQELLLPPTPAKTQEPTTTVDDGKTGDDKANPPTDTTDQPTSQPTDQPTQTTQPTDQPTQPTETTPPPSDPTTTQPTTPDPGPTDPTTPANGETGTGDGGNQTTAPTGEQGGQPGNSGDGGSQSGDTTPDTGSTGDGSDKGSTGDTGGTDTSGTSGTDQSGTSQSGTDQSGTSQGGTDQSGGGQSGDDQSPTADITPSGLVGEAKQLGSLLGNLVRPVLPTSTGTQVEGASEFFGKPQAEIAKHSSGQVATGSVRETYAKGKHSSGQYVEGKHAAIARTHGSTEDANVLKILSVVNKPTA